MHWVPPGIVVNLARIDVNREQAAVILTLRSGTQIVDRQDRIDVIGTADDVAVGELVEAVRRRGWDAVEVHGEPEFRRAVELRLALLDPPVTVAGTVLSEADRVTLDTIRQSRTKMTRWPLMPDAIQSSRMLRPGFAT